MTKHDRRMCFFALSMILFGSLFASEISQETYAKRRQKLMDTMGGGIAIFVNHAHAPRSNDTFYYPFRSNSDFYYLTGLDEPEAAFLLLPGAKQEFIMFVLPKNAISSQWFGDVPGIEGAMNTFDADTAFALDDFEKYVKRYLYGKENVFYDIKNEQITDLIQSLIPEMYGYAPKHIFDVNQYVHEMRIIKDNSEIDLIRNAVNISCDAHLKVMKALEPGMFEYQVAAIFSYIFENNGSHAKAYESLVASGPNATIYHYSKINRRTEAGDMLLMDMGAEYQYYAADITRVIPVNGKFTKAQKDVYEIVLDMMDAAIEKMIPGNTINDCLNATEPIAKEGLYKLGLITDKETTWQHYLYFFPYTIHPVGLDVHDVGDYSERKLEPGMVFAVEPLLYVGDNLVPAFKRSVTRRFKIPSEEVEAFLADIKPQFEQYKHIPARVEDNILVTKNGNENLSSHLPKTVEEIEKRMKEKSFLNYD